MAKTNRKTEATPIFTHGGARAVRIGAEAELRRSVMACLLFEDEFYEDGESIAARITKLVSDVPADAVRKIAIEAREQMKLRHVPLLLAVELAKQPLVEQERHIIGDTVEAVIQRPDELAEILAIYQKQNGGRKKLNKLSKQIQKGIGRAFNKFNEYSIAKYNQDNAIKLRDVLFLTHPKPDTRTQQAIWNRLAEKTLATPDTWEVGISATKGVGKKEEWERLLMEEKLGALAVLRNLRNFKNEGVDEELVETAIAKMKVDRVLPFRFLTAAKYAPQWEPQLEAKMYEAVEHLPKLTGKTILLIDVSGSMQSGISGKSELTRVETAAALAILVREQSENLKLYLTAGSDFARVHKTALAPARRGFAVRDLVVNGLKTMGGGGIFLTQAMDYLYDNEKKADRIIVLTDEADCDLKLNPAKANAFGTRNYLINLASYQNGIGYGKWTHIDGWSEAVLQYIAASEGQLQG